MRDYIHFLNVVNDLRGQVEGRPTGEYELLRASGLIRLLIRDRPSLVDTVNAKVGLPIEVSVSRRDADEPLFAGVPAWRWIDPNPRDLPAKTVSIQGLKDFKAVAIHGKSYSVDQVIGVCANKLGGVHYDDDASNMTVGQRALKELHESATINDVGMLARTIAGIGVVLVDALGPLCDEVRHRI